MSTYTQDQKDLAISRYLAVGCNEAAREVSIPAPTISRWAKAAGKATLRPENVEAAIKARMAQTLENLSEIALTGTEVTLEAIERDGADVKCHQLVGAWTRAIHDIQLLTGQATERMGDGDAYTQALQTLDELAARKAKKEAEAA